MSAASRGKPADRPGRSPSALTVFIVVILPIVFLLQRTPLERSGREVASPPPHTPADTIRS